MARLAAATRETERNRERGSISHHLNGQTPSPPGILRIVRLGLTHTFTVIK